MTRFSIKAKTTRIALVALVFTVGAVVAHERADAASYQHMDMLALRIQANSAKLYQEFQLHYRHTQHYPHLISDASTLYARAKHIHAVTHHGGNLHHIASDLRVLDRSFHHLEQLLHRVEFGGHGHVHGHTSHVHQLMKFIERDLHHLRADVEALTQPCISTGPGYHHGHGQPRRHRRVTSSWRNPGEIRSGWKISLNDL